MYTQYRHTSTLVSLLACDFSRGLKLAIKLSSILFRQLYLQLFLLELQVGLEVRILILSSDLTFMIIY